jgi:uncharacterized protein (TIGR02453 family)
MADPTRFGGFPEQTATFLRALARHNRRDWFEAHREQYQSGYLEPAQAFVNALAPELRKLSPGIRAEPRVNGSIMRIQRDTRFSRDKTPYKTALHCIFPEGDSKASPGFYLRLAPGSLGVAAGLMGFDPRQLERYRKAVVDPRRGRALREAMEKARKAGPYELSAPALKRVPRGYDAEHPNAALLKHKGFGLHAELDPAPLFGPEAVAFTIARFRELRPVQQWLLKALA